MKKNFKSSATDIKMNVIRMCDERYGDITNIVYLAGPMRGYPNFNKEAFHRAEEMLLDDGYQVINPARNPTGLTQREYMQIDVQYVFTATHLYMLKGWGDSYGARVEYALGEYLGLTIIYEE